MFQQNIAQNPLHSLNTIKEPDYLPWAVVAKMNITKLEEII
jgi:hypothetical protein